MHADSRDLPSRPDTALAAGRPDQVMQSDNRDLSLRIALDHHAAEWGLASLLLAGFLLFAAILTLLFGVLYSAAIPQMRPGRSDVRVTVVLSSIVIGLLTVLSVASVIVGIVGLRSAGVRRQPAGLPLVGLLLSLVVTLLWAAVVTGLVMTIEDFSRRQLM